MVTFGVSTWNSKPNQFFMVGYQLDDLYQIFTWEMVGNHHFTSIKKLLGNLSSSMFHVYILLFHDMCSKTGI